MHLNRGTLFEGATESSFSFLQCPVDNGPLAGPVPTVSTEREGFWLCGFAVRHHRGWLSVGLHYFGFVRASFRGTSSLYCGDLARSFLRLLGVVFVNGELGNPVPSWPSVCCTKRMRLLQRPWACFGGLLG